MTTEAVKLEVQPRTILGKKVSQLRRAGIVPVHLYGPGIDFAVVAVRAASGATGTGPVRRQHPHRRER